MIDEDERDVVNRQNNSATELTGEEWSLVVHCIAKEIEAEICRFQQQEMPLIGAAEVTANKVDHMTGRISCLTKLLRKIDPLVMDAIKSKGRTQ